MNPKQLTTLLAAAGGISAFASNATSSLDRERKAFLAGVSATCAVAALLLYFAAKKS